MLLKVQTFKHGVSKHSCRQSVRPTGLCGDFLFGLYGECDGADFECCGTWDALPV